ncbi:Exodeoxyribonuclease 7 small subunit [Enhygromyxa salina]|uniref:Exodeoxyribonuclease 7 small subunit n=1 Tax=Enhygromyxa salina TaxID=215803 RepID=A0A2S9XIX8_9BACT|nr:exodeoxyribonuclease VII small subunit [Enhygromyxa salina]PRP92828.1 Exodeoxyribonuclease 7 small subunit [Enhygromyxa salina]
MAGPAKSKKAPRKAGRKAAREGAGSESEGQPTGASAEALLGRLDQVVRELEGGELPLEQALARFEEGVKLVRDGEQLLASVEQRIEILLADDQIVPFADDEDYADDDEPETDSNE